MDVAPMHWPIGTPRAIAGAPLYNSFKSIYHSGQILSWTAPQLSCAAKEIVPRPIQLSYAHTGEPLPHACNAPLPCEQGASPISPSPPSLSLSLPPLYTRSGPVLPSWLTRVRA